MSLRLGDARRVVVKVGSSLLVDPERGELKREWLEALAGDIAALRAGGADVLVVSSGAIALGRRVLGLSVRAQPRLEESQAAAAVGQIALAKSWADALGRERLVTAQVLLTLQDTEQRRRYLNARNTLATLLSRHAVPVINENDTVATSEIRYGDNDRLAARVTSMIGADCLVLLSDVEGLFTAPPGTPGARLVPQVDDITADIEAMAGRPMSDLGSGGMVTKIEAARIATGAGADLAIAWGQPARPLSRIAEGAACTWFKAKGTPLQARKRWIAGTLVPVGRLTIDDGAALALRSGKSLLPAGVRSVEGSFSRGDAVSVLDGSGSELARGIVAYDSADAARIGGRRSAEIADLIGFRGRDEMIHRDDLVLTPA